MSNNPHATQTAALLAFARNADDLEAEASLEADATSAALCGHLQGTLEPFLAAGSLIAAASRALDLELLSCAWRYLDAAEGIVQDLRLEHGCEDWDLADWSRREVCEVDALHAEVQAQRQRARQQRDQGAVALEAAVAAQKARVA